MVTDEDIIKLFCGKRQINSCNVKKYLHRDSDEFNDELYTYIIDRFDDSSDIYENINRIRFGVEIRPVCQHCGGSVKYIGKKDKLYADFCSVKCAQNNKNTRKKRLDTSVERYGFGCNVNKMKETCLRKYGVDNVFKSEAIKEKIKNTCTEHFGVDNPGKLQNTIQAAHTPEINIKRNDTKRKNGTFNTSIPEDESYVLLKERFPDLIRNYKEERYPYNCDFYVPSLDLFIECNYHWTHQDHIYNPDSETDRDLIKIWESKHTDFYDNAIHTWTIRDVNKFHTASENGLNYLLFYNIEELKNWLND